MKNLHSAPPLLKIIAFALLLLGGQALAESAPTKPAGSDVDIIDALAMNAALMSASVSPDGERLAVLRRRQMLGDPVIEIYELDQMAKKPFVIGADIMKIAAIGWVNNERLFVLFTQDSSLLQAYTGSTRRAQRIATIDYKGKKWVTLPRKRTDRRSRRDKSFSQFRSASIFSTLPRDDKHILLSYDPKGGVPDIYKVNVSNGKATLIERGNTKRSVTRVDPKGRPRLAASFDFGDTALISWARLEGNNKWFEIGRKVGDQDFIASTFSPLGFFNPKNPDEILVMSNHESNTIGIYKFDLRSKSFSELLFRHPQYDARGLVTDSDTEDGYPLIQGYTYADKTVQIHWLDEKMESLASAVGAALPGRRNSLIEWSRDFSAVLVRSSSDVQPPEWYLLRDEKDLILLGSSLPLVRPDELSPTEWTHYTARDGMKIPALVTTPQKGKAPYPTVVMPHGGPIARDMWDFDPWLQLLAYHGYLVIQPQFRGSEGFGRKHLEASYGQWGWKMQDDVEDAARFLIQSGKADPKRLAVFGWSYGGYAAFVASYRDPNIFHCAIAGAGVSDLAQLRANIRQGSDLAEKAFIPAYDGQNPLEYTDSVDIPILVIHGTKDERVLIEHSDKFVAGLQKHNKKHEYIKLDGANHFFGTIFYEHYKIMYPAMIDWLDNTCGLKPSI